MGRAVSIHPLAVVLGISTGGVLAGIVGALLAVPTIAFFNSAIRVLLGRDDDVGESGEQDYGEPVGISMRPDQVGPASASSMPEE
jgi:putative heme transporter